MTKRERHFRRVPKLIAQRHGGELFDGYSSAYRVKRLPTRIDKEPQLYFAGARYCKEDYEHLRGTLGDSRAFCIGWAVALEEIRDRTAPIHALAELF